MATMIAMELIQVTEVLTHDKNLMPDCFFLLGQWRYNLELGELLYSLVALQFTGHMEAGPI